jgi:hypothetical protein
MREVFNSAFVHLDVVSLESFLNPFSVNAGWVCW